MLLAIRRIKGQVKFATDADIGFRKTHRVRAACAEPRGQRFRIGPGLPDFFSGRLIVAFDAERRAFARVLVADGFKGSVDDVCVASGVGHVFDSCWWFRYWPS